MSEPLCIVPFMIEHKLNWIAENWPVEVFDQLHVLQHCSGPMHEFIPPELEKAAREKYPFGMSLTSMGWAACYRTPDLDIGIGKERYRPLDYILYRLGTVPCPRCEGIKRVPSVGEIRSVQDESKLRAVGVVDLTKSCPTCNGEGRIGTCCTAHYELVTSGNYGPGLAKPKPPRLDPSLLSPLPETLEEAEKLGLPVRAR